MMKHRVAASAFTKDGYLTFVATKPADVPPNPGQRCLLVLQTKVAS